MALLDLDESTPAWHAWLSNDLRLRAHAVSAAAGDRHDGDGPDAGGVSHTIIAGIWVAFSKSASNDRADRCFFILLLMYGILRVLAFIMLLRVSTKSGSGN